MDSSVQLTPPRVEFYVLGSAAAQDRLRAACQLAGKGWRAGLPVFIRPSDKYSLPSGHTAAAFLMASLLAAFYPAMAVVVFVWAGCIGASRLLLGVHYLTDLIAGALLGSGCALLVLR